MTVVLSSTRWFWSGAVETAKTADCAFVLQAKMHPYATDAALQEADRQMAETEPEPVLTGIGRRRSDILCSIIVIDRVLISVPTESYG
jgi:hypothetical protein